VRTAANPPPKFPTALRTPSTMYASFAMFNLLFVIAKLVICWFYTVLLPYD
jgi:hypothetical protein